MDRVAGMMARVCLQYLDWGWGFAYIYIAFCSCIIMYASMRVKLERAQRKTESHETHTMHYERGTVKARARQSHLDTMNAQSFARWCVNIAMLIQMVELSSVRIASY